MGKNSTYIHNKLVRELDHLIGTSQNSTKAASQKLIPNGKTARLLIKQTDFIYCSVSDQEDKKKPVSI